MLKNILCALILSVPASAMAGGGQITNPPTASNFSGTLAVGNGGTGATTLAGAGICQAGVDCNTSVPQTFQSSVTIKASLGLTGASSFLTNQSSTNLSGLLTAPKIGVNLPSGNVPAALIHLSTGDYLQDGSGTLLHTIYSNNADANVVFRANTSMGIGFYHQGSNQHEWEIRADFNGNGTAAGGNHLWFFPYNSGKIMMGGTTNNPATQLEVTGDFSAGSGATKSTMTTTGAMQLAATIVTSGGSLTAGNEFQVGGGSFAVQTDGWSLAVGTMSVTQLSGCGANTSFTAGSNNNAGKINTSITGAMTCVMTFKTAAPGSRAPACVVTNETTANLMRATSTSTQVSFIGTVVSGDVIAYLCMGL